jgi:hypothetical protein
MRLPLGAVDGFKVDFNGFISVSDEFKIPIKEYYILVDGLAKSVVTGSFFIRIYLLN